MSSIVRLIDDVIDISGILHYGSSFSMGLYGSLYDYMIYVALIAILIMCVTNY